MHIYGTEETIKKFKESYEKAALEEREQAILALTSKYPNIRPRGFRLTQPKKRKKK